MQNSSLPDKTEFHHIMKLSLIALSTLIPTTPLFTEVCHQPFTEDQWRPTEACRQRLVDCLNKVRPAALQQKNDDIPQMSEGIRLVTSSNADDS